MKKSLLATLIIFTMLFVFIPVNKVKASTPLEDIRFTGNVTEIVGGELGGFDIQTSTESASIEDIRWVKKARAESTWQEIEEEPRVAVVDNVTKYGLKIKINLSDDYIFSGTTSIYYNGRDMVAETESGLQVFDGGGYVVIDLGKARRAKEYTLIAKTFDNDNQIEGSATVGSFSITDGTDTLENENDIEVDALENVTYTANAFPAEGYRFVEWAECNLEDDLERRFRVSEEPTYSFEVNHDIKLYAVFEEDREDEDEPDNPGPEVEPGEEPQGKNIKYEIPSVNKQATAIFYFVEGHEFEFNFNDVLQFDPAFVEENMGIPADMFNAILEAAKNNTEKYGTMLCLYSIEINGINNTDFNYSDAVQIRIKMTPEMKKYDSFKLVYLDEENDFAVSEVVGFTTIEGDEIVFDLKHLSAYALVGEKTEATDSKTDEKANPKTGDSIIFDIVILVISIIGLVYTNIAYKNKDK